MQLRLTSRLRKKNTAVGARSPKRKECEREKSQSKFLTGGVSKALDFNWIPQKIQVLFRDEKK